MILSGEKRYEFRRAIFKRPGIKKVVIYASSPVSKVVGEFEIEDILSLDIRELWLLTMEYAGIDKEYFDRYFSGKEIGYAIKVRKTTKYTEHKDLREFNVKYAPQSFAYI